MVGGHLFHVLLVLILYPAPTISVYNNARPRLRMWTLNAYQINIKEAVEDGVNATNEPQTPSEGAEEFLQILEVAGAILDTVSEVSVLWLYVGQLIRLW